MILRCHNNQVIDTQRRYKALQHCYTHCLAKNVFINKEDDYDEEIEVSEAWEEAEKEFNIVMLTELIHNDIVTSASAVKDYLRQTDMEISKDSLSGHYIIEDANNAKDLLLSFIRNQHGGTSPYNITYRARDYTIVPLPDCFVWRYCESSNPSYMNDEPLSSYISHTPVLLAALFPESAPSIASSSSHAAPQTPPSTTPVTPSTPLTRTKPLHTSSTASTVLTSTANKQVSFLHTTPVTVGQMHNCKGGSCEGHKEGVEAGDTKCCLQLSDNCAFKALTFPRRCGTKIHGFSLQGTTVQDGYACYECHVRYIPHTSCTYFAAFLASFCLFSYFTFCSKFCALYIVHDIQFCYI